MKRLLLPIFCAGWITGCDSGIARNAQNDAAAAATAGTNNVATMVPTIPATNGPAAKAADEAPIVATTRLSPPPELPEPVQEVVRLHQRVIGEGVVVDYIRTIKEPFTLSADQVIYLNDLGISVPVIQALLKRSNEPGTPAAATQTVIVTTQPAASAQPQNASEASPAPSANNVILNPYLSSTNAGPTVAQQGVPVGGGQPGIVGAAPGAPATAVAVTAPAAPVVVNQQIFHESLAPYGSWVDVPNYGWCWQPTVAVVNAGWRPYVDGGNWLWTDYGWYWNSTYSWGWAPFHYGRWHRNARLGWVWAPGLDWGPAWVAWRSSPAFCGWAPLPPECRWNAGVGFSWWNGGLSVGIGFGLWNDCWFGTPWNRFCDPLLPGWGIGGGQFGTFVNNSTITVGNGAVVIGNNNTVIINNGITRDQVQRHTRQEIGRTIVRDVNSPGAVAPAVSRPASGAARATEVAAFRPRLPNVAARPSDSVISRQELRRAPATAGGAAGVSARPATAAAAPAAAQFAGRGEPSRLTSTAGARPSAAASSPRSTATYGTGLNSTRSEPARPGAASSSAGYVAPSASARPNGITGLTSTRPGQSSVIASSDTGTRYPGANDGGYRPSQVTRSELVRPSQGAQAFGRGAAVPNAVSSAPSTATYGNPAARPSANGSSMSVPARPNFPAATRAEPARPSYTPPAYSAPARPSAPASSYSAPMRSEPSRSYSAPAARPAPSYSPPASYSRPSAGPSYSPAPAASRPSPSSRNDSMAR
jgi:hypothetical protein